MTEDWGMGTDCPLPNRQLHIHSKVGKEGPIGNTLQGRARLPCLETEENCDWQRPSCQGASMSEGAGGGERRKEGENMCAWMYCVRFTLTQKSAGGQGERRLVSEFELNPIPLTHICALSWLCTEMSSLSGKSFLHLSLGNHAVLKNLAQVNSPLWSLIWFHAPHPQQMWPLWWLQHGCGISVLVYRGVLRTLGRDNQTEGVRRALSFSHKSFTLGFVHLDENYYKDVT